MADHPLRPATRHSLGRPLPYQLADGTRASLGVAACATFPPSSYEKREYGVLATFSDGYPPPQGELLTRYSPVRHSSVPKHRRVRLACVRHAASVRPEPGSNPP